MPNFAGKGAPSFGAGFKGLADMLASALRGGVVGALGGPGDIESLISSGNSHLLPRSEDMNRLLPEATQDPTWKGFEEVGSFLPSSGAKVASKAAPAALAALPPFKLGKDLPGPVQDTLGPALKVKTPGGGTKPAAGLQIDPNSGLAIGTGGAAFKEKTGLAFMKEQMKALHGQLDPTGNNPNDGPIIKQILALQKDIEAAKTGSPLPSAKKTTPTPQELVDNLTNELAHAKVQGNHELVADLEDEIADLHSLLKTNKPQDAVNDFQSLKKQEANLQKQLSDAVFNASGGNIDHAAVGEITDKLNHLQDQLLVLGGHQAVAQSLRHKAPLQLKSIEETGGSLHHGSKRNDLALFHGTNFNEQTGEIPRELTHLSLMVPSPKFNGAYNFGNNLLVADPRKFEPSVGNTIIKGSDFYTPRYASAHFKGLKDPADVYSPYGSSPPSRASLLRLGVKERQADTNKYRWEKGGAFKESGSDVSSPWGLSTKYSPEFSSFKHFEEHPLGAARLDLHETGVKPEDITQGFSKILRMMGDEGYSISKGNAEFAPHDERFSANRFKFNQLIDPNFWTVHGLKDGKPLDRAHAEEIANELRHSRKQYLDKSPSEYAEVKRFGTTATTGDNFSHAILEPEIYRDKANWLRDRGVTPINYEDIYKGKSPLGPNEFPARHVPSQDMIAMIARLQAQTLRGRRR